ncbi:hypothetical protein K474DRAFT_1666413, partial [Panus rudis PR-1116 ss-1]
MARKRSRANRTGPASKPGQLDSNNTLATSSSKSNGTKNEICRDFKRGSCGFGSRCRYSHDVQPDLGNGWNGGMSFSGSSGSIVGASLPTCCRSL